MSYSGFVIPETGELFVTKPDRFMYETSIESIRSFLSKHPAPKGKKYALIMDNAPWYKKAKRRIVDEKKKEYNDIMEAVEFIMLPPYSPDLNPIEQVWRITRKENTHNVFFKNKEELSNTVDTAFNEWSLPNE